jgi:hypothetical protein
MYEELYKPLYKPCIKEAQAIICMVDIDTPEGIREMIRESKERTEKEVMLKVKCGDYFLKKYG